MLLVLRQWKSWLFFQEIAIKPEPWRTWPATTTSTNGRSASANTSVGVATKSTHTRQSSGITSENNMACSPKCTSVTIQTTAFHPSTSSVRFVTNSWSLTSGRWLCIWKRLTMVTCPLNNIMIGSSREQILEKKWPTSLKNKLVRVKIGFCNVPNSLRPTWNRCCCFLARFVAKRYLYHSGASTSMSCLNTTWTSSSTSSASSRPNAGWIAASTSARSARASTPRATMRSRGTCEVDTKWRLLSLLPDSGLACSAEAFISASCARGKSLTVERMSRIMSGRFTRWLCPPITTDWWRRTREHLKKTRARPKEVVWKFNLMLNTTCTRLKSCPNSTLKVSPSFYQESTT